jgi:Flp pilus assembly protein TadD
MHAGLLRGVGAPAGPLVLGAGALIVLALFAGDGSAYGPLVGIGAVALFLAAAWLALWLWGRVLLPQLDRAGNVFVLALLAFVLWNGLSVLWSITPDRSWEYMNRGFIYLAFTVLGLVAVLSGPKTTRFVAAGLTAALAGVIAWALLGKVVPAFFPDSARVARLRDPIGYWNGLALVAALALPLAMWVAARREHARWLRIGGTVLLFLTTVALLLTYSRGGAVVALVAVAAFVAVCPDRLEVLAALGLSVPPAVGISAWAFSEPGLVADLQPSDKRMWAGIAFGAFLTLGGATVGVAAHLLIAREERFRTRIRWRPSVLQLAGAAAVLFAVVVVAVSGGHPVEWVRAGVREFTNPVSRAGSDPGRLASFSSNSRWTWWEEAWQIFTDEPVGGTGAASFSVARRPIRVNTTHTLEPHSLPLQFLAETGLVGLLLFGTAAAAAGVGIVAALGRLDGPDRAAAQALAIMPLAYALHALIDYDWDFVALTAPIMFVVGFLLAVGRPSRSRPASALRAVAAAVASAALVVSLASPWFAEREVNQAYAALAGRDHERALDEAELARSLNPLSIEPLLASAAAHEAEGDERAALVRYVEAVDLQPHNWRPWFELGRFEVENDRIDQGINHLRQARELDPLGPANDYLAQMGL